MKVFKTKKIIVAFIGISICSLLLYLLYTHNRESFKTLSPVTYSEATITDYNNYQNNVKPVLSELQTMGVPEADVKAFISSGKWPYSSEFIDALKQTVMNTPNADVNTFASSIDTLQKQRPQQSFIEMFSAMYSYGFNILAQTKQIGCNIDPIIHKSTGDSLFTLENGKVTSTPVANSQLPTLIPGFIFLKQPCNPCNLINREFSCPYAYPESTGKTLYPGFIMNYIWGLSNNTSGNTVAGISTSGISTSGISTSGSGISDMFHKYLW